MSSTFAARLRQILTLLLLAAAAVLAIPSGTAHAHGIQSVVYADVTSPERGTVSVHFGLEYDLFIVSATKADTDPLYAQGYPAWEAEYESGGAEYLATMQKALNDNSSTVLSYIAAHFVVSSSGGSNSSDCRSTGIGPATVYTDKAQGVPYFHVDVTYSCDPTATDHTFTTSLFYDGAVEGFKGSTTIATYSLDTHDGTAALGLGQYSFSTDQSFGENFKEFFHLGTNHILTGLDHLLFLVALIVGSRRLREVVLAASTFTIAHLVTLALTAAGAIHPSDSVVEPLIALSIAAVAAWHLWQLWRKGDQVREIDAIGPKSGAWSHFALDRAGWLRLAIVFAFGLVHGMGFAGALGIDNPWSWHLIEALLIFSIGIETVQLSLIILIFPLLALLRRRQAHIGLWASGAVALGVAGIGMLWFVGRLTGWYDISSDIG